MKILIDIPEETYEYWKTHSHEYVLSEAIKNGIPVESSDTVQSVVEAVRAEINATYNHWGDAGFWEGVDTVFEHFDKYTRGEHDE